MAVRQLLRTPTLGVTLVTQRRWSSAASTTLASLDKSPFDAIFVINLDHRTDRWEFTQEQLRACGLLIPKKTHGGQEGDGESSVTVQRYSAVKGAEMCPRKLCEVGFISRLGRLRLEEPEARKIWGMDLNYGAVGCALSHIDLWGKISAAGYRAALILEDDSIIPKDFVQRYYERMKKVPPVFDPLYGTVGAQPSSETQDVPVPVGSGMKPAWDLIYLSGLDTERKGHLLEVPTCQGLRFVPRMHRTTNCYVTHANGCERLLQSCVPLTYQLDTQMTLHCAPHPLNGEPYVTNPRCYTTHPPLVVQATRFGSDIQQGNTADPVKEEASRIAEAQWDPRQRD